MLEHRIDMSSSGEQVRSLFVNRFELVGDLEDLDCSVDTGGDCRDGIWQRNHHILMLPVEVLEVFDTLCWDSNQSLKG